MDRGLVHLFHSLLLGVLFYLVMVFLFRQSKAVAEDRSVLLAGVALVYMTLFGHGLPGRVNRNIM
jgi:hypothetical protein